MMPAWKQRIKPVGSLNAQIKIAERQVLKRRQSLGHRTTSLLENIYKQMTAPATLVLASGIGFIAGELSKCPTPPRTAPLPEPTENRNVAASTHLRTILSLLLSAHSLYNALPITWLRKRFQQSRSKPAVARRHNRETRTTNKAEDPG
ncbi:hypothetical protein RO575_00115 [Methylomonas sp. MO1]|uniref:hypothetical protein n=1 Tax=Methylomonas sp. MO1 TaxID=3073619 RepID=UPI0028A368B2|nr:hypothetical protein [Methylomonas sp. MO1]MDT4287955.1 hypothetical protein [Methylomonas sp. MO1]